MRVPRVVPFGRIAEMDHALVVHMSEPRVVPYGMVAEMDLGLVVQMSLLRVVPFGKVAELDLGLVEQLSARNSGQKNWLSKVDTLRSNGQNYDSVCIACWVPFFALLFSCEKYI